MEAASIEAGWAIAGVNANNARRKNFIGVDS
jgi:hypothetical protein